MFVMVGLCLMVVGFIPLWIAWARGCCARDSDVAWDSWVTSWTNRQWL